MIQILYVWPYVTKSEKNIYMNNTNVKENKKLQIAELNDDPRVIIIP